MKLKNFSFHLIFFFFSCSEISREDQIREECDTTRYNSYLYMIPLLQRHATNGVTETNALYWVGNTEITYNKCISESKKNQLNLRSN
ncbi:hypothetical protein EHQ79_00930 [Leptospira jelokensis]|nr:hypothetical protein EHQ79_00930 [Leptospira jelokensis]